jgi:hypothetical protein
VAAAVVGDLTTVLATGRTSDLGAASCHPLGQAAWLGILEVTPEGVPFDAAAPAPLRLELARPRYHGGIAASRAWLRGVDAGGRYWSPGLLAEAEERALADARFAYLAALPRSAHFGETLARALLGPGASPHSQTDSAIEVARLVNLFVTCFDGICDETQEFLPETVPYLRDLVTALPGPPPPAPVSRHPLVTLTHAIAVAVARAVSVAPDAWPGPAVEPGGPRAAVAETVRVAFGRQLTTLRPPAGAVEAERERLSAATFAVTFAITAAYAGATARGTEALLTAAPAVGALFGWVDDLVDLPVDLRAGRPNMIATGIVDRLPGRAAAAGADPGRDPQVLLEVRIQAARRWRDVRDALARVRDCDPGLAAGAERVLLPAVWAWLGFPVSGPAAGPHHDHELAYHVSIPGRP